MQKIEEELYWLDIYQKYSSKVPDGSYLYPYVVHINYPVFHPAVYPVCRSFSSDSLYVRSSGMIFATDENNAIQQFTNIKEFSIGNPANIDASVCYMKRNHDFWKKNYELADAYKQECRICWKTLNNNEPLLYACHVLHKNCVKDKCYVCHSKLIM